MPGCGVFFFRKGTLRRRCSEVPVAVVMYVDGAVAALRAGRVASQVPAIQVRHRKDVYVRRFHCA